MSELESAIREVLIKEEVSEDDALLLSPYLFEVFRAFVELLPERKTLTVAERAELASLRVDVKEAAQEIESLEKKLTDTQILHNDAVRMLNRIAHALGVPTGSDFAAIVAAAERLRDIDKTRSEIIEEERQKVADLEIQLADEQRQRARIADTLNEIDSVMEKAKRKEEGKS